MKKKELKEKGIVGSVLVVAMLVSLIIASLPVIQAAEVKFTNSGSTGVLRGEGAGSSRTTMSAGQSAEIGIEVDYEVTVEHSDTDERFSFKKKGSNSASDPDHGIEVAVDGRVSISGSVRENGTASAGARVHAEGSEVPPAEAEEGQTGLWIEADVSTYARTITGDDGTAKAKSDARGKAEGEGSWVGVGDIFADVSGRSESSASSRDLSEAQNLAGLMGYADLSTAESFKHYDEATIYSDSTASGAERAKADGSASGRATASFIAVGEGTTLDAASYTEGKGVTSSADARNEGSASANAFATASNTIWNSEEALALVQDISSIYVVTDTGGTQADSYASGKATADVDTSSEAGWYTDTWLLESATGASGKARSKSTIRGIASAESTVLTESEGEASADQLSDTSQVKIESKVSVTASKAFTEGWVKKATTSARSLYSAGEDEDPIAESKTMVEAKGETGRISARDGEAYALVWARGDQEVGPDPTDPTNSSVYAFSMVYTNVSATDESRAYPSAVLKSAHADVFAYHNDSLEAASWVIDGSGKSYLKPKRDIGYSLTAVAEAAAEGDQCLGAQNHYIVTNEEPNRAYSYTWTLGASYIGAEPPIPLPTPPMP